MRSTDVAASRVFRPTGSLAASGFSHGSVAMSLGRGAKVCKRAVSAAGAKAISEALLTE